jgi:hypothetical protein
VSADAENPAIFNDFVDGLRRGESTSLLVEKKGHGAANRRGG